METDIAKVSPAIAMTEALAESVLKRNELKDEAVLVRVQNVYEYAVRHGKQQGWDDLTNFHCSRLPFPSMMFSWLSRRTVSGHAHTLEVHLDVACKDRTVAEFVEWFGKLGGTDHPQKEHLLQSIKENPPHRIVTVRVAAEGETIRGVSAVFMDERGQLIQQKDNLGRLTSYVMLVEKKDKAMFDVVAAEAVIVAMASVNFMNCRNVEIVDNPPTRQQRRHAERMRERPPVTYKTLVIHPIGKRRLRTSAVAGDDSVSLHICRGHFKDYRKGEGLGRWHRHGLWWWSAQVRGTAEHGRVVKDYSVDTGG